MADDVAPEFVRFINAERRTRSSIITRKQLKEGQLVPPVNVQQDQVSGLLRVAARRAAGLFRPSRHTEVVWVQGDGELAVSLVGIDAKLSEGFITVLLPVHCDQTGEAVIEIVFAVGTNSGPAGLYASTYQRPNGPPLIVDTWGENLVAFAWQCLLGLVSGLAGAAGKDARGNVLVPVELTASQTAIRIVPMARYRFAGSSGLKAAARQRGEP